MPVTKKKKAGKRRGGVFVLRMQSEAVEKATRLGRMMSLFVVAPCVNYK